MYRVELSKRALHDLRGIDHTSRKRLLDLLENDLSAEAQPANLDIKQLTGRAPWLHLRRGEYRVLYRPLTDTERQPVALWQSRYLQAFLHINRRSAADTDRRPRRPTKSLQIDNFRSHQHTRRDANPYRDARFKFAC
jgi:mRNA-degrading endonuclease RelE of RelBE toxin-antitoxin system